MPFSAHVVCKWYGERNATCSLVWAESRTTYCDWRLIMWLFVNDWDVLSADLCSGLGTGTYSTRSIYLCPLTNSEAKIVDPCTCAGYCNLR